MSFLQQPDGHPTRQSPLPQWSAEQLVCPVVSPESATAVPLPTSPPNEQGLPDREEGEYAAINDPVVKVEESRESTADVDLNVSASDNDDELAESMETLGSLAEQHNLKRRMRRFRLNHQQTRFLMNEFARHPHPDAAQRDKISQEIPGLSARQVQVWFQNRRAKMKRLTEDDRERMMQSRALPEGFDASSALHSTFARPPQPNLRLITSLPDHPQRGDAQLSGITPQTSQYTDSAIPQSGTISPFTEYAMTPTSVLASPCDSVISPTDSHSFTASPYLSQESSPRNLYPFERKRSLPFNHNIQPSTPMTRLQQGMTRLRADSLGLPPRPATTMQHSAFRGLRHHSSMVGLSRQAMPQRRPPLQSSISFGDCQSFSGTPSFGLDYSKHMFQQPSGLGLCMSTSPGSNPIYENPQSPDDGSGPMFQDPHSDFFAINENFAPDPPMENVGVPRTEFDGQQPMYQFPGGTYYQPVMQR